MDIYGRKPQRPILLGYIARFDEGKKNRGFFISKISSKVKSETYKICYI